MTSFEAKPETAHGRAIYEMLLAVHALIRRDLGRVERLAAQALDGIPAEDLRQELHEIKEAACSGGCRSTACAAAVFVHLHHNAEDDFFSELRDTNPAINPVIDRL